MWRSVCLYAVVWLVTAGFVIGCAHPGPATVDEPEMAAATEVPATPVPSSFEKRFDWETPQPRSIAVSPDGSFALYSTEEHVKLDDGTARVVREIVRLDLREGTTETLELDLGFRPASAARGLAVAPGGDRFAAAWHGHVGIVDLETNELVRDIDRIDLGEGLSRSLERVSTGVVDLGWASGGDLLVGITSEEILWWDAASGEQVSRVERRLSHPRITTTAGGRVAVVTEAGVEIFDEGNQVAIYESEGIISTLALSPDGTRLAAAFRGGPVRVWDADGAIAEWSPETAFVPRDGILWFGDSEHVAVGSREGNIAVRHAVTGEPVTRFQAYESVAPLRLSADGRQVLTWSRARQDGYVVQAWTAP